MATPARLGLGGRRTRPRHIPPVLDQILNGGRCVSLPVARTCRTLPPGRRLFTMQSLNRTFIFKLPNPEHDDGADAIDRRPLDTGVFVPYDEADPARGGFAIYIRAHRSAERFRELLGVALEAPEGARDARVLKMLDELPSLDPFLLKDSFVQAGLEIDEAFTVMAEEDAESVRVIIRRQLYPILAGAMTGIALERRLDRLVTDIFNPGLGEARMFLSAFGIRPDDMPLVFGAWKGVAFYRSSITRHASPLASALRWLGSKDALPQDLARLGSDGDRLLRLRGASLQSLAQLLQRIDSIFVAADRRFDELARQSDAAPFRQFLRDSCDNFRILGRAAAAIAHGAAAFRSIGWPHPERPSCEGFERLLVNLDLACRRSPVARKEPSRC